MSQEFPPLRRVLLVHAARGDHEWERKLFEFANDVTHVTLDNPSFRDLLSLPAGCCVIDGRGVKDTTILGYIAGKLRDRGLRVLLVCREQDLADDDKTHLASIKVQVAFDETPGPILTNFLKDVRRRIGVTQAMVG